METAIHRPLSLYDERRRTRDCTGNFDRTRCAWECRLRLRATTTMGTRIITTVRQQTIILMIMVTIMTPTPKGAGSGR